jgi:hypothetical protein
MVLSTVPLREGLINYGTAEQVRKKSVCKELYLSG